MTEPLSDLTVESGRLSGNLISPRGVCGYLGRFRFCNFSPERVVEVNPALDLESALVRLNGNHDFSCYLIKNGDGYLSDEEIRAFLPEGGVTNRLRFFLNRGIDYEILPAVLLQTSDIQEDIIKPIVAVLDQSEGLRIAWAEILTDEKFDRWLEDPRRSELADYARRVGECREFLLHIDELLTPFWGYSEAGKEAARASVQKDLEENAREIAAFNTEYGEIDSKIRTAITATMAMIPEADETKKTAIEMTLSSFFDLSNVEVDARAEKFKSDLKVACMGIFFEEGSFVGSRQSEIRWRVGSRLEGVTPVEVFRYRAIAEERARYLQNIYMRVISFYARYFPEIYLRSDSELVTMYDPKNKESEQQTAESHGSFDINSREITITSETSLPDLEAEELAKTMTVVRGIPVTREVADAFILMHELTHRIYRIRKPSAVAENFRYVGTMPTIDRALDEGLAVLVETLFVDMVSSGIGKEFFSFDEKEQGMLKALKTERFAALKKEGKGWWYGRAYFEGTVKIIHKIFKQAAGNPNSRDISKGLLAVRNFIERAEPGKLAILTRDDPRYCEIIRRGDINGLAVLLEASDLDR